jgi:hypothetical protein
MYITLCCIELYSPNIIRVIKSRRMRWEVHVACMMMRNAYKILVGNLKGRDHSEDLSADENILLERS